MRTETGNKMTLRLVLGGLFVISILGYIAELGIFQDDTSQEGSNFSDEKEGIHKTLKDFGFPLFVSTGAFR